MKTLTVAVKIFSLSFSLVLLTGFQKLSAQLFFANDVGSRIKISNNRHNSQFAPITSQLFCNGHFTMTNGELQYLDALKFNLPINLKSKEQTLIDPVSLNTPTPTNDIDFELTHSMVLPELNMIHVIGYLTIEGVKVRADFHLNYIENNGETITIMGKRSIKLSDYKKDFISVFADGKAQDIIQLDLKLVLKNPSKVDYLAKVTK